MLRRLPYTRFDNEVPTGSGGRQQRCKAVLILVPSLVLASLALASSSRVAVMPQLRDEAIVLNATYTLPSPFCSPLRDMACGVRPITISTLVGMALGPLLVPLVFAALCCCGFGAAGVIAGSCAAGCQAPVTAKGGCFATLQSCGALGCCWQRSYCWRHRRMMQQSQGPRWRARARGRCSRRLCQMVCGKAPAAERLSRGGRSAVSLRRSLHGRRRLRWLRAVQRVAARPARRWPSRRRA